MNETEQAAAALLGRGPSNAVYRALVVFLADCGLDDPCMYDADDFRGLYHHGGYSPSLLRLDPVANPAVVDVLRERYALPGADWDTLCAALTDDPDGLTLYDTVTGFTFLQCP